MPRLRGSDLSAMLADGWEISGYAVNMMAAGALAHNVLLRKDNELRSMTIIFAQEKELGRNVNDLT